MALDAEARRTIRRLSDRLDVEEIVDAVAAGMAGMPEYDRFVGDLAHDRERGRAAIAWNLATFFELAEGDGGLRPGDVDRLGDLVAVRAAEGRPPEEGLAVYREGLRMVWNAVLARADAAERAALSGVVDDLLAWLNVVARVFQDVYAQRRDALISQQERRARRLLDRIVSSAALSTEDASLADMLGLRLADRYRPLTAVLPGGTMLAHIDLAARIRATGVLAATDGPCVVGLGHEPLDVSAAALPPGTVVAQDVLTPLLGLEDALADLRTVIRLAVTDGTDGTDGPVDPGRYLPELLALRAPDLAAKVERRVFGELSDGGHPELATTLVVLAGHGFERGAAAAALPVHRNTLAHRIARIHALTALAVDDPDDRGLIWLAARLRRSSLPPPARPAGSADSGDEPVG